MNEHEKHNNIGIATLELLQIVKKITVAHSRLVMHHYTEASEFLVKARTLIDSVLDLIPEEEDE